VENDRFRNKLSAYKDGELDGKLNEAVSLHLQSCHECRKELAEFEQVDSLIKEMPKLEAAESFTLQIIAGVSKAARDRQDSEPFSKRVLARMLELADYIFELVSAHEHKGDTLDEFSDFPPLSISHAYFQALGEQV
jgi:anti-sigma factor RsiW